MHTGTWLQGYLVIYGYKLLHMFIQDYNVVTVGYTFTVVTMVTGYIKRGYMFTLVYFYMVMCWVQLNDLVEQLCHRLGYIGYRVTSTQGYKAAKPKTF